MTSQCTHVTALRRHAVCRQNMATGKTVAGAIAVIAAGTTASPAMGSRRKSAGNSATAQSPGPREWRQNLLPNRNLSFRKFRKVGQKMYFDWRNNLGYRKFTIKRLFNAGWVFYDVSAVKLTFHKWCKNKTNFSSSPIFSSFPSIFPSIFSSSPSILSSKTSVCFSKTNYCIYYENLTNFPLMCAAAHSEFAAQI